MGRSSKIKLEHFKNMVAVASVDGHLDPEENSFLAEKAAEFELMAEEVAAILKISNDLQKIVPENDIDREEQLADAVYTAVVNGEVSKTEYELCVQIAKKLNFAQKDVDELIQLIQNLWKPRIE